MSSIQDALIRAAEKYDSDNPEDQGGAFGLLENNKHKEFQEKVGITLKDVVASKVINQGVLK